jgi:hypothetical protein
MCFPSLLDDEGSARKHMGTMHCSRPVSGRMPWNSVRPDTMCLLGLVPCDGTLYRRLICVPDLKPYILWSDTYDRLVFSTL